MSLEHQFNDLMAQLPGEVEHFTTSSKTLIPCLDLTLLDEQATRTQLDEINQLAIDYKVAAVCILPQHLPPNAATLAIHWATVVNFPKGSSPVKLCLKEIDQAHALNFCEIDYVMPYRSYLSGQRSESLEQCLQVIEHCKSLGLKSKIILESGAFPSMLSLYEITQVLCEMGCDFIKTSTGKTPQGASLDAVFAITSAIKESGSTSAGIKISGGVRTRLQALQYAGIVQEILNKNIDKSWFRIGASTLLKEL